MFVTHKSESVGERALTSSRLHPAIFCHLAKPSIGYDSGHDPAHEGFGTGDHLGHRRLRLHTDNEIPSGFGSRPDLTTAQNEVSASRTLQPMISSEVQLR